MLQKIKDLLAVNGQIDVIKNNLNYTTNSMNELKTEVGALKQKIIDNFNEIDVKKNEFFKKFNDNMDLMKTIRQDFEKELFDFKLLRGQMQKKIIEKFEEELGNELKIQMDNLKGDAESYNHLREEINQISGKVNLFGEEISKFTAISRSIKKEDFELTRFANQLTSMDKEKLELIQKIDTLERLISKMRRQEIITR